jgi:hypothetical protein
MPEGWNCSIGLARKAAPRRPPPATEGRSESSFSGSQRAAEDCKNSTHCTCSDRQSRFTHYYFYIRDEVLGPIVVRMASFFPFHATCWLNDRSFMEQELKRKQIGFSKNHSCPRQHFL